MSFHFKSDGTLDMRYSSSKSYVSSGGSCYGPSYSTSSGYSNSSNYSSNNYSSNNNYSNNDYHYKRDGTLDMRYNSSKSYVSSGGSNNGPRSTTSSGYSPNYSRNYSSHNKTITRSVNSSKNKDSLYTDKDIILNQDGSINKRSRAVQSGEIQFRNDGKIDGRCYAMRNGKLIIDSDGNVDSTKMGISTRVNPDELGTSVLRHPNEQRKYREQSRSTNKNGQHASHVIDLEVAKAILSTKPGTHLTEQKLHEDMKPLNQILRMRSKDTNMNYDKDMAQRIVQMVRGENITVTRGLENKINQMKDAMNKIPQEEMNSSLQYIKNKLNDLSSRCQ